MWGVHLIKMEIGEIEIFRQQLFLKAGWLSNRISAKTDGWGALLRVHVP
jgi:hypothetical protein